MNVILIGYRGSGKTTIGKKLAAQLWKTFVDVDAEICKRFGTPSIAEIWQTHGEPAFRKCEVEVTKQLVTRADHVIGLGGGTVMQPAAREAVENAPDTKRIYLYCAAEELAKRITSDTNSSHTRPNLTNLGGGLEEIQAVLAKRDPIYRQVADDVCDVTYLSPDEAVKLLTTKYL